MYLFINTTEPKKQEAALIDKRGEIAARKEIKMESRRSNKLLPLVHDILRSKRVKKSDLLGVLVVEGPGPFSAVRSGVVVANTFAYALGIPVKGLPFSSRYDFGRVLKNLNQKKSIIVLPVYGKEPNITVAK